METKHQLENKPGIIRDEPKAIEAYLFYVRARDNAREVLKFVCNEYTSGRVNPIELESVEDQLDILFNELDFAERTLYNRSLRQ